MAANLALKFTSSVTTDPETGDLIVEFRAEFADAPLPETPPIAKVSVDRLESDKKGPKKRGHVRVLEPDATGSLPNATVIGDSATGVDGSVAPVTLKTAPVRTADSYIWRFFVASQAGGKQVALIVKADVPPAKRAQVTTQPTSASLPKPSATPTKLPLTPPIFPRLVVGIDAALPLASAAPGTKPPNPFSGLKDDIQPCLERFLARLKDEGFVQQALEASLVTSSGQTSPKVVPSTTQAGNTTIQDAELAWANQVATMQLCTPYGGPNALYNLNDDDLLVRTINSPPAAATPGSASPPPAAAAPSSPVFPIVFACQHLGTFAVASRGRGLFKTNKAGRFLLIGAGAKGAATWTSSQIGKWFITDSGGTQPQESTDGGNGDPSKIAPSENLETSALLFQIKNVASTHPFGSCAVFLYSNRPARNDGDCKISNGVETCLLRDNKGQLKQEDVAVFKEVEVTESGVKKKRKVLEKNADGTIKTIRQVARTTWAVTAFPGTGADGQPAPLLADNTAGAHMAYVLRVDNKTQLFQTLDTGGVNVPNRGNGVVLVPAVAGFHGGIFDDPATNLVNPAKAPLGHDNFRGVGVIQSIDQPAAEALRKHVDGVLKKARPMGLCRIVLLRRDTPITYDNYWRFKEPGQNFLLYASPALPMYDANVDTLNFPISRYLWAMRDFPDAANVEAMCFFYVPQGPLGQAMINAPREDRVTAIANAAFSLIRNPKEQARYRGKVKGDVKISRLLADFCLPVLNATVEPTGETKLVATYKTKLLRGRGLSLLHGLEGRYGSRLLLPLDQSFLRAGQKDDGFPPYFRSV
jgi:hypothetical protein